MSKKMKRVCLESSSYGVFEDRKSILKHQILLQDYQELHKETDDMRHRLEDSKLRKLRFLAEVRFLRQRRTSLLRLKSLSRPQGQQLVPVPNPETYDKNRWKDKVYSKKEAKLNKLRPLPGPKQNGRIQVASKKTPDIHVRQKHKLRDGKDDVLHNAFLSLNPKARVYSGKEVPSRKGALAVDLQQNERLYIANSATVLQRRSTPAFDLNQETGHSGKEVALPTRAPVFDLNEISMGEEETQANFEQVQFEEPKRSLIRNLNDDQHNDLKLLVCRNVGEGTSQVGKRKLSWQDPVALRV